MTPKQKKILNVILKTYPISAVEIFDTLENIFGHKRRSRLNSFRKILGRMVAQRLISKRPDGLYAPLSNEQISRCYKTDTILNDIRKVRQDNKPLTLTNLLGFDSFPHWTNALVKFQQTIGDPNISIHEQLDIDTEKLESLMILMEVDLEVIAKSELVFCKTHEKALQQSVHQVLCEKISHYGISRKKFITQLQESIPHSSPLTVIKQIIEPTGMLSPDDLSKILESFKTPFFRNHIQYKLEYATFEKGEPTLAKRFPTLFSGQWKWDLLYAKLLKKMIHFAKSQNIYQSHEEWLAKQKQESKQCFQQTQVQSHYAILGLSEEASLEEVKMAFRQLSKKHHPDSGGNAQIFQNILTAYHQIIEKK